MICGQFIQNNGIVYFTLAPVYAGSKIVLVLESLGIERLYAIERLRQEDFREPDGSIFNHLFF